MLVYDKCRREWEQNRLEIPVIPDHYLSHAQENAQTHIIMDES